jgi:deazaflavin-dependent oxidoreductase (nitroreductase family)
VRRLTRSKGHARDTGVPLALNGAVSLKREFVHRVQRVVVNPVGRQLPVTMLETTGRKSGQPRHAPVGGKVLDNQFWMVSEHGDHSDYVRNIKANPAVRLRLGGKWRNGTAHLLPDDDPVQRLEKLPRLNSAVVRVMGSDLLTIRVDLD